MASGNLCRNKGTILRYEILASIYDKIMSHVEYEDWIFLLDKIIDKYFKNRTISILELGGGTGLLGEKLKKKGYSYQGSDLSFSMAKQSKRRNLPFICADARKIPFKKKYDCILFLYDGINYLLSIEDYVSLFYETSEILADGGILLFDITTETNSLRHFYDYIDVDEFEECTVIRHSYYDELMTIQHNDFTIFKALKNNLLTYEKYKEKHEQKVFPAQIIEEAIPREYFTILGVWDEFSMRKATSRSERVHFLLQRRMRR